MLLDKVWSVFAGPGKSRPLSRDTGPELKTETTYNVRHSRLLLTSPKHTPPPSNRTRRRLKSCWSKQFWTATARLYAALRSLRALVHGILLARVPRAEVDDLVQDIFLHAFKKLHTLRDSSSFGPWIAMIARNRAVDFHRRSRETVEINDELRGSDHRIREPRKSWN